MSACLPLCLSACLPSLCSCREVPGEPPPELWPAPLPDLHGRGPVPPPSQCHCASGRIWNHPVSWPFTPTWTCPPARPHSPAQLHSQVKQNGVGVICVHSMCWHVYKIRLYTYYYATLHHISYHHHIIIYKYVIPLLTVQCMNLRLHGWTVSSPWLYDIHTFSSLEYFGAWFTSQLFLCSREWERHSRLSNMMCYAKSFYGCV